MGVYERTIDELKSLSEESFRSFSKKILVSDKPLIGVRTSAIKAIAKTISIFLSIYRRISNIAPVGLTSICSFPQ